MFCENCGAKLEKDARFCSDCGAAVQAGPQPAADGDAPQKDVSAALPKQATALAPAEGAPKTAVQSPEPAQPQGPAHDLRAAFAARYDALRRALHEKKAALQQAWQARRRVSEQDIPDQEDAAQSAEKVAQSADTADNPAEKAAQSADTADNPAEKAAQSADTADNPPEKAAQSADTADNPAEKAAQSADTADKPAEKAAVALAERPAEEPDTIPIPRGITMGEYMDLLEEQERREQQAASWRGRLARLRQRVVQAVGKVKEKWTAREKKPVDPDKPTIRQRVGKVMLCLVPLWAGLGTVALAAGAIYYIYQLPDPGEGVPPAAQAASDAAQGPQGIAPFVFSEAQTNEIIWGDRYYINEKFVYSLRVPKGFEAEQERADGSGLRLYSMGYDMLISLSARNLSGETLGELIYDARVAMPGTVVYSARGADWFSITSQDEHRVYYRKGVVWNGKYRLMELVYGKVVAPAACESLTKYLEDTFVGG